VIDSLYKIETSMEHIINPITTETYKKYFKEVFSDKNPPQKKSFGAYYNIVAHNATLTPGKFFWRIYDTSHLCLMTGGMVDTITPYSAKQLMNAKPLAPADMIRDLFHPDDQQMAMAFVAKYWNYIMQLPLQKRNMQSVIYYVRLLNKQKQYKWVAISHPRFAFDDTGKVSGGLILYTDISNTGIKPQQPLLTIMDSANEEFHVYSGKELLHSHVKNLSNLPKLSNRELQVITQMKQGFSSKQIAYKLGIAKNTVENHRQRLLKKFKVNSTIELIGKFGADIVTNYP
jgi:DNA-binding CsgD family transcriptional regulator